jgi:O-antigen ligase
MIFAQRKRIGLAFSLLRRELPLTLLLVVDLLFRYAAATVDDVASPSDINSGRAEFCYTHGGVIFLQFGILLYFYSFRLHSVIPTRV